MPPKEDSETSNNDKALRKPMGMGCAAMNTCGNVTENWKKWIQAFKLYLRASSLDGESDARKVALFLHMIGERGIEIFNSFEKDEEKITYAELLKLFNDYFIPKTNLTYECHNFFTYKQEESETLEEFITNLRAKSQSCKFESLQERLIKSMLICNMHPRFNYIRERLLLQDDLTLEGAIELSKSIICARNQSMLIQGESQSGTVMYTSGSGRQSRPHEQFRHRSQSRSQKGQQSYSAHRSQSRQQQCGRCGQIHRFKCPAANVKCHKCHKVGHFQKMCRFRQVNFVHDTSVESEVHPNDFFVGHIGSSRACKTDWSVNIHINDIDVNCILDTGSDANVMSVDVYNGLGLNSDLTKCHTKIKSYSGDTIEVMGEKTLQCKLSVNNKSIKKGITFIIANVQSPTVLGKDTCAELGLVKRVFSIEPEQSCNVSLPKQSHNVSESSQFNETKLSMSESSQFNETKLLMSESSQSSETKLSESCTQSQSNMSMSQSQIKSDMSDQLNCNLMSQSEMSSNDYVQALLKKYDNVFVGLGCLPGECHITVNTDIPPKIDAPRKVPFALYPRLQQELDKMERMGVIAKVTEPTEWVSSLILVEKKNGQLRVCLDPRNLNQAICRSHYPIPTVDIVRSKVAGAKFYSTLDASSGFWMCCLDEKSSYLTTFNSPFGRYRFKRLAYGINCAPEYFHRIMTETFGDIPGVTVYSDDLLVSGSTMKEHNERLAMVFEKAQKLNVKFNRAKCSFAVTHVKYLGHIFSAQGVKPDNEKIRAITEMPSPTCTKDLQRFLGMINYLGPFINNLANEVGPLRELLKKESVFTWNENYERIFNRLKSLICDAPVLAHFDVKVPIVMSVDASSTAVGGVLLQNNHPIYYASKTLTASQQKMAQIEKELYAIVFACVRFHQFIYGQTVTVETDHCPLITLFKKPLAEVPTRLQRMMLKIQAYSLNVIYKRGTLMFIADTLSRAALSETSVDKLDDDIVVHVNSLIKSLPVSPERLQWLKDATKADEDIQIIKNYCFQGWPKSKSQVLPQVKEYWQYRHDLHTEDDLLFRSSSIVIPKKIRPDILKIIHSGHLGIERSKSFARGNVFWPFMSSDIKNLVESCHICIRHRNSNPPQPLMSHSLPNLPWEKLGIDYMSYKNSTYLVVEDYYSNYIEVISVSTTSASILINTLKPIFSRHGIPIEIISDNGPPFNSVEFKKFTSEWDIKHTTSSPYLPRSNGLVESGVKICKKIFTKCDESGSDPYLALLQYRNTPRGNLASPAQLLMSRSLRTQLPTIKRNLCPKVVRFEEHIESKKKNQVKVEQYYNKKTTPLEELRKGEMIYYKKNPESVWVPGEIKEVCSEPRSYVVGSPDGFIGRRNRQHILRPNTRLVSPRQEPPSTPMQSGNSQPATDTSQVSQRTATQTLTPEYTTRAGRLIKPPKRLDW